ncbi:hypothetical protein Scep_030839 [Stephania cephalantha]|uniref:GDSL esterase/lipase n=1 Tax=Stephania cephalantha TaxID=152367 RepID=A0AAP0E878_9MAGN
MGTFSKYYFSSEILSQIVVLLVLLFYWLSVCSAAPSVFVFGDSLADVGNNNYIASLSKANYIPNGIDFGTPTGRYTNGKTIADIICQELGVTTFPPPYLAPTTTGDVVIQGVNYASGGGGILNHTGTIFVGRINMDAQLDNFANTRQDIISRIGAIAATKLLRNSIFSVIMGSNDLINNFQSPAAPIPSLISQEEFANALISRFRVQLTRLYSLGARKIIVANVGPIGCIPYQRDLNKMTTDDCVALPNQLANLFNGKLRILVMKLRSNLEGSNFVYADAFACVSDIVQNYKAYGFENPTSACCRVAGRFGGLIPCAPPSKVCPDRSKYVFWDPYHPSEASNMIIAKRLTDGDSRYVYPINVRKLVQL